MLELPHQAGSKVGAVVLVIGYDARHNAEKLFSRPSVRFLGCGRALRQPICHRAIACPTSLFGISASTKSAQIPDPAQHLRSVCRGDAMAAANICAKGEVRAPSRCSMLTPDPMTGEAITTS